MVGLALASLLLLAAAQYFIFVYAPLEQTMGLAQKIFYIHLPMSWWALISFGVVFGASVVYLAKRCEAADRLAGAAAELGVLCASLSLATGMLWGKPIWNVWWTWDPRLTTALIMWFVYVAYLLVRAGDAGGGKGPLVRAVLGVVAFLDVPLVFISARYWRSIHPTVIGEKGGMEPEMWHAMLVSLAAFGCLWAVLLLLRARQLESRARLERITEALSESE